VKLMSELYLRPPLTTPHLYRRSPRYLNPLQKLSEHPLLESWRSFGDWGFKLVILGVIGEVVAALVDFVSERSFQEWHVRWKPRLRLSLALPCLR